MLFPNKHSHPDQTVLAAATALLRELRKKQVVGFDELSDLLSTRTKGADFLFTPALTLLHLLGLVDYLAKIDSFEYIGEK
jgi:hypothetical protein